MSSTNPDLIKTAHHAFEQFSHGLATGEWQSFLDLLTNDFSFWFPVGPYQGWNEGKDTAADFFQSVSEVFAGGLSITIQSYTSNETTVVFEARSQGKMFGYPYQNQAAIAFEIRGNQICAYREYLGVLYQLGSKPDEQEN